MRLNSYVCRQDLIVEAFDDRDAPRYLIRDQDGNYGLEFRSRVQSLGINEVMTAPQSPWRNGFVG